MSRAIAWGLAAACMLSLASCAAQVGLGSSSLYADAPRPPASAEQDLTAYNNQQVAAFVTTDQGWRAWLNAFQTSAQVNDAIRDSSTSNTPVVQLIQAVSMAHDAYRSATTFALPSFLVKSSCRQNNAETNGSVRLSDGLVVRYSFQYRSDQSFYNGSSCRIAVGSISEVDSPRGLPVVTIKPPNNHGGGQGDSVTLIWDAPFSEISRESTWSLSDLVEFIESGKSPQIVKVPSQCILF
jgi:hypothetical protein